MKDSHFLRCFVYKEKDLFIAVCLDLSLACQGYTMEEVIRKLEDQIKDYFKEIGNEPQLRKRYAPLSLWLKYYWLKFCPIKKPTQVLIFKSALS